MRSEYYVLPEWCTTQSNQWIWGSWSKICFLDHYSATAVPFWVYRGSVSVEQRQRLCGPDTVSVWDTDSVSVPHRHWVCSTQTMSLFHRDRTPVDPECTGYAEAWSRKFILDHGPQFRGFPLVADQSGKTENSDLDFLFHDFWMNIGQIGQKSRFSDMFS